MNRPCRNHLGMDVLRYFSATMPNAGTTCYVILAIWKSQEIAGIQYRDITLSCP